jgi:hypothetical protein
MEGQIGRRSEPVGEIHRSGLTENYCAKCLVEIATTPKVQYRPRRTLWHTGIAPMAGMTPPAPGIRTVLLSQPFGEDRLCCNVLDVEEEGTGVQRES